LAFTLFRSGIRQNQGCEDNLAVAGEYHNQKSGGYRVKKAYGALLDKSFF